MRRIALSVAIISLTALVALGTYLPYGQCTWFVIKGVLGPAGDVTVPLPSSCILSNEQPPPSLFQTLDEERQKRGLVFEKLVSCRMPARQTRIESPLEHDPRWLPSYVCCTWQYRRHVLIQAPGTVETGDPGLVVSYVALMPRLRYAKQIGGQCDYRFQAWR
jgi:hypothetical protein